MCRRYHLFVVQEENPKEYYTHLRIHPACAYQQADALYNNKIVSGRNWLSNEWYKLKMSGIHVRVILEL